MKQLAVLGSPIGQALSPVLHRAAYRALGLNRSYRAIDCTPDRLATFLAGLDDGWAGLSLTMSLKRAAVPRLDEVSQTVKATGTANTVTVRGGRLLGENTDVARGRPAPGGGDGRLLLSRPAPPTRSRRSGQRRETHCSTWSTGPGPPRSLGPPGARAARSSAACPCSFTRPPGRSNGKPAAPRRPWLRCGEPPKAPSARSLRARRRDWMRPAARRCPADAAAAGPLFHLWVRTAPRPEGTAVPGTCGAEQNAALGAVRRQGDHEADSPRNAPPRERNVIPASANSRCTPP